METKTPTREGRGLETLAGNFLAPFTLNAHRVQLIAARYALPIETAAIVAALALGSAHHG